MKRNINKLLDYKIITKDDITTSIKDFIFDEDTWTIRYIEVDFGNFFTGKRVLIPNVFFKKSHLINDQFFVDITKNELEKCPKPEEDLPVSRRYEEELASHFNLDKYWTVSYPVPGLGAIPVPKRMPSLDIDEKEVGTSLRSFKEIKGYDIITLDERFGVIDDLIVEDSDWKISYLCVDTSAWLPFSKKIIVDISIIDSISYKREEATVQIHTEDLKNAPEYDTDLLMDPQFENRMHEFYSRHLV